MTVIQWKTVLIITGDKGSVMWLQSLWNCKLLFDNAPLKRLSLERRPYRYIKIISLWILGYNNWPFPNHGPEKEEKRYLQTPSDGLYLHPRSGILVHTLKQLIRWWRNYKYAQHFFFMKNHRKNRSLFVSSSQLLPLLCLALQFWTFWWPEIAPIWSHKIHNNTL